MSGRGCTIDGRVTGRYEICDVYRAWTYMDIELVGAMVRSLGRI